MKLPSLVVVPAFFLNACVLDVVVPAQVTLPVAPFDLDGARTALEARVCADAAADACVVLGALDRSDGAASTPLALPERMPREIDVAGRSGGDPRVDVQRWLGEEAQPAADVALVPSRLVRLDEGSLAALEADSIAHVEVDAVALVLSENTLTLDLPEFDLYIGNGVVTGGDGVVVAKDADSALHIATSAAHAGGVDGQAQIHLADGAVDALRAALVADEPWIELRPRALPPLTLDDADVRDPRFVRPGGQADIAVDLQLIFPARLVSHVEL